MFYKENKAPVIFTMLRSYVLWILSITQTQTN